MAYKLGSNSNSGAYDSMQKTGLIAGDQSIFNDGDPKKKVKVKVNRKGETITKEKIILPDGTKKKSKAVQGPTTYKINQAAEISANVGGKVDGKVEYFSPQAKFDPGTKTQGDKKPYVKPLKKVGYREAYEKTDKSIPFEEFKEKSIRWKKENPGKKTPPSINTIPGRSAVKINTNSGGNLSIRGVQTITPSTYSSYEEKIKRPTDKTPPPSKPPGGGTPPGDGLCTKDNPDACTGAFENDGPPGSMINKMFAKGDNEKLASKNAAKDAKSRKSAIDKAVKSSTKDYRKEQLAKVKQSNKAFAKEMGAETKAEKKELKSYQKDKLRQTKIGLSDRRQAAESRKNKNARQRFRQANNMSGRVSKINQVGAKITTGLLGKKKQEARATAGSGIYAKKNKAVLQNKELAAMTNKNRKNRTIKASF